MSKIKPKVFIASSVEGLPVADAINLNLDHDTYPTLWRTGTFKLGSSTIDDLVKKSSAVDFAVFVFTPDDAAVIREQSSQIVRDNVLFELGLFIGALGKERCYIVRPRGTDMHLPSDLLGITTADYESNRPDGDLGSALNAACKQIKDEITRHGPIHIDSKSSEQSEIKRIANPPQYILNSTDLKVLAECTYSQTSSPQGLAFYRISNNLQREPDGLLRISAIKLERLGYIEKSVQSDYQDNEPYYAYSITDNGIDIFLKHEKQFISGSSTQKTISNFNDMDDEIPF